MSTNWTETTREKYREQLEIVPPFATSVTGEIKGFAVGEAMGIDHARQCFTYDVFIYYRGRYFTSVVPLPLSLRCRFDIVLKICAAEIDVAFYENESRLQQAAAL